jgi:hypothetical protein
VIARGHVIARDHAIPRLIVQVARDPRLLPRDLAGTVTIRSKCVLDSDRKKSAEGWNRAKDWNDESVKLDLEPEIND